MNHMALNRKEMKKKEKQNKIKQNVFCVEMSTLELFQIFCKKWREKKKKKTIKHNFEKMNVQANRTKKITSVYVMWFVFSE